MTTATREQSLEALELGNRIRIRRASLKKAMKAGDVTLSQVMEQDKVWLYGMKVKDLVRAVPRMGESRVIHTQRALRIGDNVVLRDLTEVRREQLLIYLQRTFKVTV